MTDKLTTTLQTLETRYQDLKNYFAADGKVTPDELQILKDVQAKIDAVRKHVHARVSGSGAQAGIATEGSKKVSKGGFEAGAVVGLHANVACAIGDPVGDPKRYPVTLTVSFGASAKVSGSGGKGAVSLEVKGSAEREMTQTHWLQEAELSGYVAALQAASRGNQVAGKYQEFAIIAVGVKQSWEKAHELWAGIRDKGITADSVQGRGDSMQLTEKTSGGAGANVKLGDVGGGAKVTHSRERVLKATRNDQGTIDVDAKTTHTDETEISGSLDAGAAGVEFGLTHTKNTRFGYSITVDPKKDPDGTILAWLNRCTLPEHYEVFLAANTGKVTVTGRVTGEGSADATSLGVSILGAKANIGTNQAVDEETVRDGKGNLVKKTIVGKAGAGGKALGHSDSVQDEAVAEIDGKGKASVTLTRTKTDGDVADKSGLRLSNDDLKKIGGIACRSLSAWNGAIRRADERSEWVAAGIAIAKAKGAPSVVAEQLARFVGGDRVERMKTIQNFLRGGIGGEGSIGQRFEFPAALKRLQASYEVVTAAALPGEIERLGATKPAAAVEKCTSLLKIIDLLDPQVRNNEDFDNPATKMEMLQRLVRRRQLLAEAMKGFGGERKPEADPALLQQAADRLQKQLSSFSVEQARVGGKLHELLAGDKKFLVRDLGDAKSLIRELSDMHNRWWADYRSMKETMVKRGVPSWDMPLLKPDAALLERYQHAAGLS